MGALECVGPLEATRYGGTRRQAALPVSGLKGEERLRGGQFIRCPLSFERIGRSVKLTLQSQPIAALSNGVYARELLYHSFPY